MACYGGREEAELNRQLNRALAAHRKDKWRVQVVKVLLLGNSGCGKSTIARQWKNIHLDGFSAEEKNSYKTLIANHVLTSIRTLTLQSIKFGYQLEEANEKRAHKILDMPRDKEPIVTAELGEDIAALWRDPSIQKTFCRSSEYQLNDSTQYYFENISRISQVGYIPIVQDVMRSREKTTGIVETSFEMQDIEFRLLDVGKQQTTLRKWIHCFEDVETVIYCVDVSEYDLKLDQDNQTNRLHQSMELFKEACNSHWFQSSDFILFLNKIDLFQEKIGRVSLSVCFPEYTGPNTFQEAIMYVRNTFLALNECEGKFVYTFYTCATDTNYLTLVFNTIREISIRKFLDTAGII